jgi:hypothetical protein
MALFAEDEDPTRPFFRTAPSASPSISGFFRKGARIDQVAAVRSNDPRWEPDDAPSTPVARPPLPAHDEVPLSPGGGVHWWDGTAWRRED